ncbi:LysR substrate-binding domain-containing protein [Streptomyces sp. NPDC020362]|uniref:LysR substrate-binding domain-containing protein n=1 Tax=unclassified Streptomyces TaxID=2593676 RepID=UPI0033C108DA
MVVPADGPPAGLPRLTLAGLAAHPVALNTVSGTTTTDLWPSGARPAATLEVTNTDEWLIAIAAGRAVGISTTATPGSTTHPSLVYRPLTDAPPVPVVLAWPEGPAHPAVPDLPALARDVLAARGRTEGATGAGRPTP